MAQHRKDKLLLKISYLGLKNCFLNPQCDYMMTLWSIHHLQDCDWYVDVNNNKNELWYRTSISGTLSHHSVQFNCQNLVLIFPKHSRTEVTNPSHKWQYLDTFVSLLSTLWQATAEKETFLKDIWVLQHYMKFCVYAQLIYFQINLEKIYFPCCCLNDAVAVCLILFVDRCRTEISAFFPLCYLQYFEIYIYLAFKNSNIFWDYYYYLYNGKTLEWKLA